MVKQGSSSNLQDSICHGMEYCLGKEPQDHLVQLFLAKARSRQDGPVPFPAESQKCLTLGKRKLEFKKALRQGGIKAFLAAGAFSWEPWSHLVGQVSLKDSGQ